MKKGIWMIVMICLCLTGCSGNKLISRQSPKAAVKSTMESLKALDLDSFNDCTDNLVSTERGWLGLTKVKEYRVFNELLQPSLTRREKYKANREFAEAIVENLSWKIKDIRQNGDQAKIDLSITNTDMTDVTGNYMIHVMENMIASDDTGLMQMIEDLADIENDKDGMLPYLQAAKGRKTIDVTVTARKEEEGWKIHVSEAFINAFMGNMNTEHYSKEVERRLQELEDQYEAKMDQWGDDMEAKVEGWIENLFGE